MVALDVPRAIRSPGGQAFSAGPVTCSLIGQWLDIHVTLRETWNAIRGQPATGPPASATLSTSWVFPLCSSFWA